MVDWLVANFGVEQLSAEVAGFTPLLLATRLGHQKLVRRLLKHDNEIRWVWGDIKQCRLRLQPTLDSHVSEGFTTVMRLLGRYDASERTQEMLLDSFLGGKLFGLVEEKWQRQARLWFWTSTVVLLAYAVLVTYVASPSMLGRGAGKVQGGTKRRNKKAGAHLFSLGKHGMPLGHGCATNLP